MSKKNKLTEYVENLKRFNRLTNEIEEIYKTQDVIGEMTDSSILVSEYLKLEQQRITKAKERNKIEKKLLKFEETVLK